MSENVGAVRKHCVVRDSNGLYRLEMPMLSHKIGEAVDGKGIYQGNVRFFDGVFDFYSSPAIKIKGQKTALRMTFNQSVAYMFDMKDGEKLEDRSDHHPDIPYEMALMQRLVELEPGEISGQFIPTKEMLHGQNIRGDTTQVHNLYAHRQEMQEDSKFSEDWRCTCTEVARKTSLIYSVNFEHGGDDYSVKDTHKLILQPVRVERCL